MKRTLAEAVYEAEYREVSRAKELVLKIPYGREALKVYACIGFGVFAFAAYKSAVGLYGSFPVHAFLFFAFLIAASILLRKKFDKQEYKASLENQEKVLWRRMNDPHASATAVVSAQKQLLKVQALIAASAED